MANDYVFVVDRKGNPLMPTKRRGRVRHLLKEGKAVVIKTHPFTVKMKYDAGHYTQPMYEGIDSGRQNIGNAVSRENGENVLLEDVRTNNKSIKKNLMKRKAHRQERRRNNRHSRQRKAIHDGTEIKNGDDDKWHTDKDCKSVKVSYPAADNAVTHKVIRGKEGKFANRKRPDGWITPSARQIVQLTLNMVKETCSIMPIRRISFERVAFDFQKLANQNIHAWEYGKGPLYGFKTYKDCIYAEQQGKCPFCGKPITQYHHIIPRSAGGIDNVKNIIGLCDEHHTMVHNDAAFAETLSDAKAGAEQEYYAGLLNSAVPALIEALSVYCKEKGIELLITDGKTTRETRVKYGFDDKKDHCIDAYAISLADRNVKNISFAGHIIMKRRHKKKSKNIISARNQRIYVLDGQVIACNRHKAENQKENSLEEFLTQYRETHTEKEVQQMMHHIRILPAARSYTFHKDGLKAICHPGDIVEYKKLNKISGKMKRNIFVCTSVNFDGKDKYGNYCAAENHIGYDNGKGKGNGNRKAKFCTVLDSGCLQCTGIERTDDYIAQLKANPSKKG